MERVDKARTWASEVLGEELRLDPPARWHRSESGGRLIHARGGQRWALKLFGPGRSFEQSRTAHRDWRLASRQIGVEVRAWNEQLRASLTPWHDQGGVHDIDLHALGELLGRLHRTELADRDPLPLGEAFARRLDELLRRASAKLGESECHWVRREATTWGKSWSGPRVASHRDPHPSNLVWASGWRLIDFEHARADAWAVDLAALQALYEGLDFETIWAGYVAARGAEPPHAVQALRGARVLRALQALVWSGGEGPRGAQARRELDALGAAPDAAVV